MIENVVVKTLLVLGCFSAAVIVFILALVTRDWLQRWSHERKRLRELDREWDNVRSRWLDQHIPVQRTDTAQIPKVVSNRTDTREIRAVSQGQLDTDIMNYTFDQIVNYQKEHDYDAS